LRIAISNLAWNVDQDPQIAELLKSKGVSAIDVAPGKYFSDIAGVSTEQVEAVRHWWNDRGIEITGMQSLLYGTTGLNVFGGEDARQAMLAHLDAICRIGKTLGATRLVFGSPKNRDRSGLSDEETRTVAEKFFRRLGDLAAGHGVVICLEPNPPCYGANFMIDSTETAEVVRWVDHPAIRMQLDTGAMTINSENAVEILQLHASLVGHIHLSEPNLIPLGDSDANHGIIAAALRQFLPEHLGTIEMLATNGEAHEFSIARAVDAAQRYYGTSR
jgi:sugar phosphate isomerase/epimerase